MFLILDKELHLGLIFDTYSVLFRFDGYLAYFVCLCGCLSIGISIMCEPGTHGGPKRA